MKIRSVLIFKLFKSNFHDELTNTNSWLGFSIKSRLGASSTLVNASRQTNFCFRIVGNITGDQVATINGLAPRQGKIQARLQAIEALGLDLEFTEVLGKTFKANLLLLDRDLEEIMACCVLSYYRGEGANLAEAVRRLDDTNPLAYPSASVSFSNIR